MSKINFKKIDGFKKLSLFDLAAARVINADKPVDVKKGDLIEILSPFVSEENYLGIVTECNETHMHVYHSDIRKTIVWNRCVKCTVSRV